MRNSILNKILALILSAAMIFSLSLTLVGCSMASGGADEDGSGDGNTGEADKGDIGSAADTSDYHDKLIAPTYKEYPRTTVNFSEIAYERPNFEVVIAEFTNAIAVIEANSISFEEQIDAVTALEDGYAKVLTMYSLANIYNSKDSSEAFWNTEYSYITANYPEFAGIVEDLFVAAANSPHAERFESEYFGEGLIEDYKDGGNLTETMIKLWADEEALEAEYSSLSTATIEVNYKGTYATVDSILADYLTKYGENSSEYLAAYTACMQEYDKKSEELSRDIFINLIKVRRLIADELGYETYMTYAYESYGRDYTAEQVSKLLDDISDYVIPVYSVLSYYVFNSYFQTNLPSEITLDTLINNGYKTVESIDTELADIYNYMLLFKLYDIETSRVNRQSGAFTAYLDSYDAPFIFMSASGTVSDYSTLIHEFGHFSDSFINFNSSTSIDQKEISSQGLEYLSLLYLDDVLSAKDIQYLTYDMLCGALETLIYQGFYAKIEELIYALPYEQITEENLNAAVVQSANIFGLNTKYVNDISVAFIPHLFIYPFYVQSYCTSIIPALEIYFMEIDESGSGLEAYKKIIDRTESDLTLVETIESAGLASPFDDGVIRNLSDRIYYKIIGSHYYDDNSSDDSAA